MYDTLFYLRNRCQEEPIMYNLHVEFKQTISNLVWGKIN